MNTIKCLLASVAAVATLSGCNGFLDQHPDSIYTDDQVFGDQNMIKSVLSNMYGRVTYGMITTICFAFTIMALSETATSFSRD